jgi:phosphoribosylanthranilate isomerase|tara:strand:+ start:531 stop:1136 length:606 start_codon:yes stop_codon:yes gene_type:complete
MPLELKICGINSQNIIEEIIKNGGCKYLGFVFYPISPRNLSIEQSKKLTSIVPDHIKKVAVLIKPENSFVEKIKDQFDYLQVYDSSPSEIKELKLISNKKIIQAIKIKKREDINSYKQYVGVADEFLFDSSGMEESFSFNWDYLKNIEIEGWFLAGGININNLKEASKISQKIDISSGLEDNPGKKSIQKVSDFLREAKKL